MIYFRTAKVVDVLPSGANVGLPCSTDYQQHYADAEAAPE